MLNVVVTVDDKIKFTTNYFYYSAYEHILVCYLHDSHNSDWKEFRDVECEVSVDRPMIYVKVKTIGAKKND